MIRKIFDSTTSSETTSASTSSLFGTTSSSTSIDTLHFGMYGFELEGLKAEGLFYPLISERRDDIRHQKGHWLIFIDQSRQSPDQAFYQQIDKALSEGKLTPNPAGAGCAYFLEDGQGVPRFVVKPVDEDIFCLNNRKELGSIFNDDKHRVRDDIPLYRSAQTDAFCWEIASLAGLEGTTPKTVMGIINSDAFYDFTRWVDPTEQEQFFNQTGIPDQEKLASIQEFIPDSEDLIDILHSFYQKELTDEEIASRFDQQDFEEVCLLLWLTYDNDAHGSNFRSYVKRVDTNGKKVYGIKKIDNGLSFPEENSQYVNILAWMPNAIAPISDNIKDKIAHLPMEQILKRMDDYELSNCKEAFQERIEIIKELASREGMTVGEIDLRLTFLASEGKELALSPLTTQEILDRLLAKPTESLNPLEQPSSRS